jgi:archaeal flagellin N-terminal-like domain
MKFMKNEEDAVSPVIGVILMVAITVILAAVIAAFVFGMGSGVQKTKNVAVTAAQISETTVQITLQGGADFDQMTWLSGNVTPSGQTADPCTALSGAQLYVGAIMTCTSDGLGGSDHVVVNALFNDGTAQVLLDTYV